MYCNLCGSLLPEGARFCPNCQGSVRVERRSRVQKHLSLLAALWFAMGALRLFAAMIVFVVAAIFPMIVARAPQPMPFPIQPLIGAIGVLVALSGLLTLLAGWGLYRRESWGRIFAIVMAFLGLFSAPFGTALGIYTLVILLPQEASEEWEVLSR